MLDDEVKYNGAPTQSGNARRKGDNQEALVKYAPTFQTRSRAAIMLQNWDAQFAGLVGKVLLDPGSREDQDADRQDVQYRVVAFERGRAAVLGPVGPEGDLRHLAVIGPAGGDEFRSLG